MLQDEKNVAVHKAFMVLENIKMVGAKKSV